MIALLAHHDVAASDWRCLMVANTMAAVDFLARANREANPDERDRLISESKTHQHQAILASTERRISRRAAWDALRG